MRTLYFDVDGTLVLPDQNQAKLRLRHGALEVAVRAAGFERLVCVGNFTRIATTLRQTGIDYDGLGVLFDLCCGAFQDESWFRSVTELLDDPEHRASRIDLACDWWYVDDLAFDYLCAADRSSLLLDHGKRILAPDPVGDGQDILDWLQAI